MKISLKSIEKRCSFSILKNKKRLFKDLICSEDKRKNCDTNFSISIDGEFLGNTLFKKRRIIGQDFEMF